MKTKFLSGINEDGQLKSDIGFKSLKEYNRKTLNEIIYDDLKARILRGDISSDDKLQEDSLTALYETSRTPIRDALRRLAQEDIIEKRNYGGYIIKELTIGDIEEIFNLRAVLESYAAALATRRVTSDEIVEMEKILSQSRDAVNNNDFESCVNLNTIFHSYLYNASKSDRLLKIIYNLWDYFYRYRKVIYRTRHHLEDSYKDHRLMLEKMKEGDERVVEQIVKEHVYNALCAYKEEVEKKQNILSDS